MRIKGNKQNGKNMIQKKKNETKTKKLYNKEKKTAKPIVEPGPPAGKVGS